MLANAFAKLDQWMNRIHEILLHISLKWEGKRSRLHREEKPFVNELKNKIFIDCLTHANFICYEYYDNLWLYDHTNCCVIFFSLEHSESWWESSWINMIKKTFLTNVNFYLVNESLERFALIPNLIISQ